MCVCMYACTHTCIVNLLRLPRYSGTYNFVKSEKRWTVPPDISTVTTVTHDLSVRHLRAMVAAGCHCQDLSAHNES